MTSRIFGHWLTDLLKIFTANQMKMCKKELNWTKWIILPSAREGKQTFGEKFKEGWRRRIKKNLKKWTAL